VKEKFLAYFGHINIDVLMKVSSLPVRGSVGVNELSENYGGTAGNFAFVSSKLGFTFDLYSAVSQRTHESYLKKLESIGVSTDHVMVDKKDDGPVCYLVSDGTDQIAYVFQGPMEKWKPSIDFSNNGYEYLHFSTGPAEEYIRIAEKKKGSSMVVFDPSQELSYNYDRAAILEMLTNTDIFMGNAGEIEILREKTNIGIRELVEMGIDVIETRGKNGTYFYSSGTEFYIPSFYAGEPRDTTGAGDSFRAGFYFGLSNSMQIRESMALGSVVAAHAITAKIDEFVPDLQLIRSEAEALIH